MDNLNLLNKLEKLGVTFCVSVPSQWGHETHLASPEELISLISDPLAIYANHYGVTKEQYLAWVSDEYSVRCSGKTSRGKQCKNVVKGGSNVSPKEWVALQGEYCTLHSEGNQF